VKKKPRPQRVQSPASGPVPQPPGERFFIPICVALFVAVAAVFYPLTGCGFINYDDNDYVTGNTHVQGGLARSQLAWVFTNTDAANWHPLTWLSHMLDCQLYGANPWGHHLTSVLLHAANAVLFLLVMREIIGLVWPALFAALLFALHPLRVESVAWIAERKDVLATMFWLLTTWAYLGYTRNKANRTVKYWLMLVFFCLGLMSKPMLVTLPFALLLLDFWPLNRFNRANLSGLLWEKTPLFLMAAAGGIIAFLAQKSQGAVIDYLPLWYRAETAVIAYRNYIGKFLYPVDLAILYPHPKSWSLAGVLSSIAFVVGVSLASIDLRRKRPYFFTGWWWYVGTLVPVIGLVQLGSQAMADRYTYIPGIGLIILLTLGARDLAARFSVKTPIVASAAALVIAACAALTCRQITFWKDSGTVFSHAVEVTENSFIARKALADFYSSQGKSDQALELYRQALELYPNYEGAHLNLGALYNQLGRTPDAIEQFKIAIQLQQTDASAYNDLGAVLGSDHLDDSLALFEKAAQINPAYLDAHMNLGQALDRKGRYTDAMVQYETALKLAPSAAAHAYLGLDLEKMGRYEEAAAHLKAALELQPGNAEIQRALQRISSRPGP
jgi:Flp pilus assembly protein TadD